MTLRHQLRNCLGSVFRPQDHILFSRLWTLPSGLVPRVSCLIASSLSVIINCFWGPCQCLLFLYSSCLLHDYLRAHELQASLSITNSRSLLKLMSIKSVMPSKQLIFCHALLLLLSIFPNTRVFSSESDLCIRWPKYWSFSFSISPSHEYSGLISFRMDLFDLLAVQGPLKSLLQHHSSKASILWCSAFFMVQLSHPYMTTGRTIALTRWIFVGKVMSLLFNMLSRLVIAFLPKSNHLLISWLQSPSAIILEFKKRKSVTVSIISPSACHEVMGPDIMIFVIWILCFKPTFSLSSFTLLKRMFSSSLFLP